MRSKFRTTFATAAAAAMVLGTAGVAVADNIQNDVVVGGNDTIATGGSTTVNYRIQATGSGVAGCDASVTAPAIVTIVAPAGVVPSPSSLTFTSCGVDQPVVFSSDTAGSYPIAVSASGGSLGADFNVNPAKFTLTVNAAPPADDTTPPVLTLPDDIITTATSNSQAVVTYEATAEDDRDGEVPVSCVPASGSLFPVGTTTVNCSAEDDAGNEATGSFTVTVTYAFDGFYRPVVNEGANVMKAGAAVPIKFSLSGDQGLDIFAAGFPKSVEGDYGEPGDAENVISTVTAGSSSLQYDAVTDTYTYVWKTDKAWANSERQFVIKFRDGTPAKKLDFQFKK
jgi:hypothetical protein